MTVVAACRRPGALYSQEDRLLLAGAAERKERAWSPVIDHKIAACFQCPDLSIGPIVSETICGALEEESLAAKKNSLHDLKSDSLNLNPLS